MRATESQVETTVLLVEADVVARTKLAAYLRECRYVVIEVASGVEAISVLEHGRYPVQAMLIDLDIAGEVEGFSLAQWARKTRPDIRVMMAATVEKAAALAGKLCEEGPHLSKPYAAETVADRIRQLLGLRARTDDRE